MITVDERRIDPTYLVTLAVVAETHNLSDAAKILGISQPGVSQQLKHLSEAVGQRLHVRSGHGVELTVAGLDLARRARDVLRSWRGVLDYVESVRQGNDGMLLLAASNTVSAYVVPRWLVRFRQRYPGVDLRSRSLNSAEVVERVIDGEAEVGVIESPVESLPPELVEIVVGGDRLVYVVSPAVVSFANNQVVGWGEVARIPLVLREVGSGVRRASEQALRARGLAPRLELELAGGEAVKEAILQGVGGGFLSSLAVARELATGELVTLVIRELDTIARLFRIICRPKDDLSLPAQRFLEIAEAVGVAEPV
ncbi:transcriptional regulator, LysR family [Acidimicrobium ferrooxidans DSM 10331]|uniref:Transcriptional regulator, LysR family n=2 Tax=Acidimicrobium ferrooxidans TaxID=53635 RepID=C7M308_ACIFD|nr:transcriptional regulator, LysR family [Acidimicrobium ferrooxidans DSM 10331]